MERLFIFHPIELAFKRILLEAEFATARTRILTSFAQLLHSRRLVEPMGVKKMVRLFFQRLAKILLVKQLDLFVILRSAHSIALVFTINAGNTSLHVILHIEGGGNGATGPMDTESYTASKDAAATEKTTTGDILDGHVISLCLGIFKALTEVSEKLAGLAFKHIPDTGHDGLTAATDTAAGAGHEFDEVIGRLAFAHLIQHSGEVLCAVNHGNLHVDAAHVDGGFTEAFHAAPDRTRVKPFFFSYFLSHNYTAHHYFIYVETTTIDYRQPRYACYFPWLHTFFPYYPFVFLFQILCLRFSPLVVPTT